jgi:TRAP-type C4-dicarboxylate transport system permease small subunit
MTGPAPRTLLSKGIGAFRAAMNWALVGLFALMVIAAIAGVLGRYFHFRISYWVEIATYTQIWMTAVGSAVAVRLGAMFALDTLSRHLGLTLQRILSVVIAALSLALMVVMFYGGVILTEQGFRQSSPVLPIRMWMIFLAVPVCTMALSIEIVLRVVERWNDPFGGDQEELA